MEYTDLIDSISKILSTTIISVIGYLCIFIIGKVKSWVQVRLGIENMELIEKKINALVEAAEQTLSDKPGSEKKYYVSQQLSLMGYDITEEVSALIESAVFKMNKKIK